MRIIYFTLIGILFASILITMTLPHDEVMSFKWFGTASAIGAAFGMVKYHQEIIDKDKNNEK